MRESYSDEVEAGAPAAAGAGPPASVSEPSAGDAEVRALIARLVPGADAALLVRALREEGARPGGESAPAAAPSPIAELSPAERELRRVRGQLALGEASASLAHALNNPLTALLAEAQLLELELEEGARRQAVTRIVELARRVIAVSRRLDVGAR